MAKILVIDDDRECVASLLALLHDEGYTVISAADGDEAWQKIVGECPEILLVDWNLPGLDGLRLVERIRSDANHRDRYAIMVTARTDHADIVAGMEAGADDYLTKPFNNDELLARIRVGLRTRALERELAERARQLTVTEMAGSLAHEIGNPLAAAKLLAQKALCHPAIESCQDVQHDLQSLVAELRRIEVLVRKAQMISRVRSKPYAGGLSIIDIGGSEPRDGSA